MVQTRQVGVGLPEADLAAAARTKTRPVAGASVGAVIARDGAAAARPALVQQPPVHAREQGPGGQPAGDIRGGRGKGAALIGIVIVAHGGLAREYLATLEHIVGPQGSIRTVSIEPEHDRAAKEAEICAAADSVDTGAGVAVVTDVFGGSPSNLSLAACSHRRRSFLYGANLPMLIKLAKSRHLPLEEATERALAAGRKYIDVLHLHSDPGRAG